MRAEKIKSCRRVRRKRGIRKRIFGTGSCPRVSVFRSLQHIYAQIIDDERGETLCSACSSDKTLSDEIKYGGNVAAAKVVGTALAQRAKDKNIVAVCFDRNGFRYGGRLKGLADALRKGGLKL